MESRESEFAFCILHFALTGLLAFSSGACAKKPPAAQPPASPPTFDAAQQLKSDIEALIDQPGHLHGIWAVAVHSLARSERLYEHNPRTLLIPASTMKLVSLAAASEAVGWDYVFETALLATGPVVNGALQGDLVIVGSGDPSVSGPPGGDSLGAWVEAIRSRGITRIDGRVIADDDRVEEPSPGYEWSWGDLGYDYGALPGALNLSENAFNLIVSPAHLEGLPPIVEPPADARDVPIANHARTNAAGARGLLWPEWRAGQGLSLNGTIGVGEKPVVVAITAGNPTEWFARALRNRLLTSGIDVRGEALDVDDLPAKPDWTRATVLHTHRSPLLAEVAKPLEKDSINLYAEAVLRLATGREGARTTGAALDAVRARLESWGIPKDGIQIVDGSGLSRRNVIAPETLMTILQRFYDASGASPFMQTLTIAGRDGTLRSRMKGTPADGNALGKTGSMSNVRTFAGYVKTADGEPLAVVVMANNFEGPASGVTATIDRLIVRLASFSRSEATPVSSFSGDSRP
jgi:serine-type D-Ala-D-Ala carboxypeptidase/endopeptidase (penicillin-binding protein 4)